MPMNQRKIDHLNDDSANIQYRSGNFGSIALGMCSNEGPRNFLICGENQIHDRYIPVGPFLEEIAGRLPVIVIRNQDASIESMLRMAVELSAKKTGFNTPYIPVWQNNRVIEPFYEMPDQMIISALREMAVKLGYTANAFFERVARAHLAILRELHIDVSLSGLNYLCGFTDMGVFHNNVMQLPCGQSQTNAIWADIMSDKDQFDLFRTVILNLASQAAQCGWNAEKYVSKINLITSVRQRAVISIAINEMYADLFMIYLIEELKVCSQTPFVLIIDGVHIKDKLLEFIQNKGPLCRCGIIARNALDMLNGDGAKLQQLADRMDFIVVLKHSTQISASAVSEIFGKYERIRQERSQGTNKQWLKWLPQGQHVDMRYSTEYVSRIPPEEIAGLSSEQAILFDTSSDTITRFN